MLNRKQLRKELAYGSGTELAKRTGRSVRAVSDWFTNRRNSDAIEAAALQLLAEQVKAKQEKSAQLQAKFEAALRGEVA